MKVFRFIVMALCATLWSASLLHAAVDVITQATVGNPAGPTSWSFTLAGTPAPLATNTSGGGRFTWTHQSPATPDLVNGVDGAGNHIGGLNGFVSFCLELTQSINASNTTYTNLTLYDPALAPRPGSVFSSTEASPMGALAARALGQLWHEFFDDAMSDPNKEAAFQLSIWKIEYDEADDLASWDLTTGNFQSINTSGVGQIAQGFLNWVRDNSNAPVSNLRAMSRFSDPQDPTSSPLAFQDQLVEIVPEPASLVIWGLGGVIGLMLACRSSRS